MVIYTLGARMCAYIYIYMFCVYMYERDGEQQQQGVEQLLQACINTH